MGSSEDTVARAREQCLREYARCADECERALERLRDETDVPELRTELIVCAAVCRVAARALEDATRVAGALVEYSVDVCRRCAERVAEAELESHETLAESCTAAAESATTLLLIA